MSSAVDKHEGNPKSVSVNTPVCAPLSSPAGTPANFLRALLGGLRAALYTHLTLPTNHSV